MAPKNTSSARSFTILQNYSWLFPLGVVVLIPSLCIIPYIVSLHFDHLEPVFPLISDAGALPPQAAYFSMLLDVVALLVFFSTNARYRQLRRLIEINFDPTNNANSNTLTRLQKHNKTSLICSSAAAFFLIMAGNFRTTESVPIHTVAAFSMITLNLIYFSIQSYISRQLYNHFSIESPPTSMIIFTVFGIVFYAVCAFATLVSALQFGFDNVSDNEKRLRWNSNDDGYMAHVIGCIAEWIAINGVPLMYLCLFKRMKNFENNNKI